MEFGSEAMVEEIGLVLDMVDDRLLPLEDLDEELLYRRHFSQCCHGIPPNPSERKHIEREREKEFTGIWDERWG